MQYLIHNKEFVGKSIREGFLEEILEGTNQILVSNLHIEKMSEADQRVLKPDDEDDEDSDDIDIDNRE